MDKPSSFSRRSVDYPKPEAGLAEWATKIKALQRQVDADEEVEQKRLEAEIAAARQARLRRSRQFSGRGLNLEGSPSRSSEKWNLPSPTTDLSSDDHVRVDVERSGHQNDALKKLMGNNAVHIPVKPPSEVVSLAAFIGGRATGPRLNRHAAQQDAHDPTQYNQLDTISPHPIFGKGGVAMPGMVSKQDLNGGRISAKSAYFAPVLEQKSAPLSTGIQRTEAQSKSNTLRTPTPSDRRRSLSPTPAVGTEDFERYRPSTSPTPKYTLSSKKSSDSIRGSNGKDSQGYRYSVAIGQSTLRSQKSLDRMKSSERLATSNLRSQKSLERVADSGLRSQKSSQGLTSPSVGNKDFDRYHPSTSPQPSLKLQKSATNLSISSELPHKQRPLSAANFTSVRAESPTKSSGRASPEKRAASPTKSSAPSDRVSVYQNTETPKPVAPELKARSWVRDLSKTSANQQTSGDKGTNTSSRQASTWAPPVSLAKSSTYASTPHNSSRERTMSTPSFLPKGPVATHPTGRSNFADVPTLARPIQPEPRISSHGPVLPAAAVVPSPAFKKEESAKDVSPSISRLQGRGFVQNMVRASLQLETHSAPSSVASTPAEKSRQTSAGKKSVLNRWQPHMRSPSPPSPTKSHAPSQVRRAFTTDQTPSKVNEEGSTGTYPVLDAPSLKVDQYQPPSTYNEPLTPNTTARLMEIMTPSSGKIGSATTMFVERPAPSTPLSTVDELGVKHETPHSRLVGRDNRTKHHITSEIPVSTGKPLIHPTKNRAKRPKKNSNTGNMTSPPVDEPGEISGKPEKIDAPPTQGVIPIVESNRNIQPPVTTVLDCKPSSESKVGRLTEERGNAGPILPLPVTRRASDEPLPAPKPQKYAGLRQALPGMVKKMPQRPRTPEKKEALSATSVTERVPVPSSPSRPRIPSTGNRATVMEVAQALHEHNQSEVVDVSLSQRVVGDLPDVQPRPPTLPNNEKRKSSYDRYSIVTLPPLKEEATPAPTPAGTLTRSQEFSTNLRQGSTHERDVSTVQLPKEEATKPDTNSKSNPENVIIAHNDHIEASPKVDVSIMFQPTSSSALLSSDSKTISVDVISISGSSNANLVQDINVFYDAEVLAIVHRSKSQPSGLVDTFVWCWIGKRADYGEKEEKKVHEFSRRYGTTTVVVHQYSEPTHLIQLIGGRLAIRQGTRAHWSPDNTAMHLIRARRGVIIIDEHDLSIKNLCSAFSYCVTILNTVYIWHGSGSTKVEKNAALEYAHLLARGGDVVVLHEGQNSDESDDSMFWMILGNENFANADYWKWRGAAMSPESPAIWRVDSRKKVNTLVPVEFISQEATLLQSVYIANCVWELFVLIGPDARGSRRDIRLALDVALKFAKRASSERPHTPNVHVLIFPSQLPLDLRLHFRDLDESAMNRGNIPDHMNLVTSDEALSQLQNTSWLPGVLKDHDMLPLGIGASSLKAMET